jgi:hypothetical protein
MPSVSFLAVQKRQNQLAKLVPKLSEILEMLKVDGIGPALPGLG